MKNTIEINNWVNEANIQYETWGRCAYLYNKMSAEERNRVTIGGKTTGQYLKEACQRAKASWEHACEMITSLSRN